MKVRRLRMGFGFGLGRPPLILTDLLRLQKSKQNGSIENKYNSPRRSGLPIQVVHQGGRNGKEEVSEHV